MSGGMTHYDACRDVSVIRTEATNAGWHVITHFMPLHLTVSLTLDDAEHFVWCTYDRPAVRKRFVWSGFYLSTWDGSDRAMRDPDGLPYGWVWKVGPRTDLSQLLVPDITDTLKDLHLLSPKEDRR